MKGTIVEALAWAAAILIVAITPRVGLMAHESAANVVIALAVLAAVRAGRAERGCCWPVRAREDGR